MSSPEPVRYKVEPGAHTKEQIEHIKVAAKKAGRFARFIDILEEAIRRLESDPHTWGDPVYRAKTVDAVTYRGILRPIVVQYAVYEQAKSVVIVSVRLFADFE
jgi:hypothetical protein